MQKLIRDKQLPVIRLATLMLVCSFFPSGFAWSQVVNDNINHRIPLEVNTPVISNTIDCTVQWDCVDPALTHPCIQYHNDQWFTFKIPKAGNYFLNISNQKCRDLYGIQIVLLKGVPCDVRSYQILNCHSTGDQDDIFIELNGLQTSDTYLINVDGYRHDFCSFKLELSNSQKGLPVKKNEDIQFKKAYTPDSIFFNWQISKDMSETILGFEIWKRPQTQTRHSLETTISARRNDRSADPLQYEHHDVRTPNQTMTYKIVGISRSGKFLVEELVMRHNTIVTDTSAMNTIDFSLQYKNGTSLTILIFNDDNNRLLQNSQLIFDHRKHSKMNYFVGHLREQGITRYRIEIINDRNSQKRILMVNK